MLVGGKARCRIVHPCIIRARVRAIVHDTVVGDAEVRGEEPPSIARWVKLFIRFRACLRVIMYQIIEVNIGAFRRC